MKAGFPSVCTPEMKLRYTLVKTRQGWKVKDVAVLGAAIVKRGWYRTSAKGDAEKNEEFNR